MSVAPPTPSVPVLEVKDLSVHYGPIHAVKPAFNPSVVDEIKPWFADHYSLAFDNFAVGDYYLPQGCVLQHVG